MSVALEQLGSELSQAELGRLQARLRPRDLVAGEVLIEEDQHHDGLAFVESGRLEVTVGGAPMVQVGPGEWVGEVSVLDPGPSSAAVRALEPSTVLCLEPGQLARLMEDEPHIARVLIRALAISLARRLRAAGDHVVRDGSLAPEEIEDPATARGWLSRMFRAVSGGAR